MTRVTRLLWMGVLFSFGFSACYSEDAPTLVALELPGLTSLERSGAFSNLYNALEAEGAISGWQVAPIFRAHQIFLNKEASCLAPSSYRFLDEAGVERSAVTIMAPYNKVLGYLFKAPNYVLGPGEKPSLGSVGLGFLFGIEEDAYTIMNLASWSQLVQLVNQNRLSAIYVTYPDVLSDGAAVTKLRSFKGQVELRWEDADSIVCWKEYEEAHARMAVLLSEWRKNGRLREYLGSYYVDLALAGMERLPAK